MNTRRQSADRDELYLLGVQGEQQRSNGFRIHVCLCLSAESYALELFIIYEWAEWVSTNNNIPGPRPGPWPVIPDKPVIIEN